jgi:hypothetical protein
MLVWNSPLLVIFIHQTLQKNWVSEWTRENASDVDRWRRGSSTWVFTTSTLLRTLVSTLGFSKQGSRSMFKFVKIYFIKTFRNICGAMQIFVNMILTIVFANEKNLSCHEGLIIQPVIQASWLRLTRQKFVFIATINLPERARQLV